MVSPALRTGHRGSAGRGIHLDAGAVYESTVQFYILPQSGNDTISTSDTQVGTALSSDFVEIAQSRTVIDAAIDEVEREEGVTLTREEVQGMAEISVKPDTRILDIVVHSEDADVACSPGQRAGGYRGGADRKDHADRPAHPV